MHGGEVWSAFEALVTQLHAAAGGPPRWKSGPYCGGGAENLPVAFSLVKGFLKYKMLQPEFAQLVRPQACTVLSCLRM